MLGLTPQQELDFLLSGATAVVIASVIVGFAAVWQLYRALFPRERKPR